MATLIQQIDGKSVHHLQSGQVINDGLNSAVKELVENALDANATSIEIRFKNYGLESLEVIDNGDGISPDNYESIALKHYTSKLRTYADLESVTTFGFRGEALSSLCALSDFHIITALAEEAPKGTKLEFENSGKLKSTHMVAASKGTTVCVANLFKNLPVRRKELERNIRRDFAKVLGLLQAYASIRVGVKFSVFNQQLKGKRTPAFATKGNPTTRENISNVFGSKTLAALVPLDLEFEMQPTKPPPIAPRDTVQESRGVKIVGHISRPVVGEGRNAPDRQMFFVNGRPCVLPQITKAFNEVYRAFNVTQSPFIFADIILDTNAYDVNVSPDKRTILLHDQADLLENIKISLTELFEKHEQTVPVSQLGGSMPAYKQTSLFSSTAAGSPMIPYRGQWLKEGNAIVSSLPRGKDGRYVSTGPPSPQSDEREDILESTVPDRSKGAPKYDLSRGISKFGNARLPFKRPTPHASDFEEDEDTPLPTYEELPNGEEEIPSSQIPPSARPPPLKSSRRMETPATITIGDRSPVTTGETPRKKRRIEMQRDGPVPALGGFGSALSKFLAPGTQVTATYAEDDISVKKSFKARQFESILSEASQEDEIEDDEQHEEEEQASPDGGTSTTPQVFQSAAPSPTQVFTGSAPASPPLFLPNHILDQDEQGDSSEEQRKEPEMSVPPEIEKEDDDDDEYIPEKAASLRAAARAARLLKEAEARETRLPVTQLLERNFNTFNHCRRVSTLGLVKFQQTSMDQIRESAKRLRTPAPTPPPPVAPGSTGQVAGLDVEEDSTAEQRLTLTVTKSDFLNMRILGQFNKGFILASRGNELFIIDQHASDEKYNFETLQATTVVQNQPLVVPRELELMAMDEIAVQDNLDVLKTNGFVVKVDPEMPTGRKCRLISLPMSKETMFGVEDLEELIHLIHQHRGSGTAHLRCSKVRSMFAMRACRKSVMVGRALPVKAMEKIVRHMGELDKPWNCPHGRPTMRHLAELEGVDRWDERDELRGGGGLQWDGEGWEELVEQFAARYIYVLPLQAKEERKK
ncbi:hypothetical protein BZA05DRAFT_430366 [Tricharina praecox]|uniref:uncharacterized protein n=1 Tax=Tricharina praecox TaxID=43433 RepID=UPI002220BCAE|nr:uncharacterized protein BZA05DRAFT_430366 [Tricharina praecox]KAI5851015.1 hypothetical protein BZA05DRAFT_430366 [Tricharina praecox]